MVLRLAQNSSVPSSETVNAVLEQLASLSAPKRPLSIQHLQFLFSKLDTEFKNVHHKTKNLTEFELRYFALLSDIKQGVNLNELPMKCIRQHYFDRSYIPLFSWFVCRAVGIGEQWNKLYFSRVRVREISEGSRVYHTLEIKGPKEDFSRMDLSIPISPNLYRTLLNFTDGSLLIKKRYELAAKTDARNPVKCHIDVIERVADERKFVGPGTVMTKKGKVAFAVIEVETEDAKALRQVRKGKHDIEIIKGAVPVWEFNRTIRDPLSSWTLSHVGESKKLIAAIRRFAKEAA